MNMDSFNWSFLLKLLATPFALGLVVGLGFGWWLWA